MTRAARLRAYLDGLGPVVWGESDCFAAPATWAMRESGRDIAIPRYATRTEALRLMAAAGGAAPLAASFLSAFAQTTTPDIGDIGVVRLSDRDVGVIFVNNGVACLRSASAYYFLRPETVLAAWSV